MTNRRNRIAEQNRLERTLEAIADGEEGYGLVFNPVTGEVVATTEAADEDRLPATQMAREGFFCGPGLDRMQPGQGDDGVVWRTGALTTLSALATCTLARRSTQARAGTSEPIHGTRSACGVPRRCAH